MDKKKWLCLNQDKFSIISNASINELNIKFKILFRILW